MLEAYILETFVISLINSHIFFKPYKKKISQKEFRLESAEVFSISTRNLNGVLRIRNSFSNIYLIY